MSIVPECIMVLGVVAEEAGVEEAQDEYQDHAQHQDHDQAAQVQRSPKPITAQHCLHQSQLTSACVMLSLYAWHIMWRAAGS